MKKGNITQVRINIRGWTWNQQVIRAAITKVLDQLIPHKSYVVSFFKYRNNHQPENALPATLRTNNECLHHNSEWQSLSSDSVVVYHKNGVLYIVSGKKVLLAVKNGDQRLHYYERTNDGGKNGGFSVTEIISKN